MSHLARSPFILLEPALLEPVLFKPVLLEPVTETIHGADHETGHETDHKISYKPEEEIVEPTMYVVILHNDPITPRAFVVEVLRRFFQRDSESATKIMTVAHTFGMSAVHIYTHEVAETKVSIANTFALGQGYPLKFTYEAQ